MEASTCITKGQADRDGMVGLRNEGLFWLIKDLLNLEITLKSYGKSGQWCCENNF